MFRLLEKPDFRIRKIGARKAHVTTAEMKKEKIEKLELLSIHRYVNRRRGIIAGFHVTS